MFKINFHCVPEFGKSLEFVKSIYVTSQPIKIRRLFR